MSMDTEGAINAISSLGEGIRELLEITDDEGEREWLDEQLTLEEQLEPQEWNIDGNSVEIEYMCDSWVAKGFVNLLINIYRLAGMEGVSAAELNEDEFCE
ncbi:hypothetical protein ACJJI5_19115 [Microbulbifer sp. EKSA008]|uniref:hypothetical protein n=1 Tax=unclassified Microbulbifer TaxID=2619833 RepID=UPI0039B443B4